MQDEPKRFLDRAQNVRWVLRFFYLICIALLAADWLVDRHVAHTVEKLFGFYALYGFVSCWMLVIVAKQLRRLVKRREDYYGD